MKTCDEMLNSLYERRAQYVTAQRKKKKVLASAGATLCAVSLLGGSVWYLNRPQHDIPVIPTPDENEVTTTVDVPTEGENTTTTTTVNTTAGTITDGGVVTPPTTAPTTTASSKIEPPKTTAPSKTEPPKTTPNKTEAPKTTATTQSLLPTYDILWADSHNDDADGSTTYEGRECCFCLYEVLKDHPVDKIAIRFEGGISAYFLYNGKTIEEYCEAYDEERRLFRLLTQLVKEGEDLKYGEALYTTGGSDGVKWAKEFYEERVAMYGEELLSKYIVDGEFLKAEVEAEVERRLNGYHPARDAYDEAISAARSHTIAQMKVVLDTLGLDYQEPTNAGELVFFATVDEFVALPKEAVCGTCHWAAKGNSSDDLFCDYE